jgi:polysaccharide pyruvyl transferase WcaK-like protein
MKKNIIFYKTTADFDNTGEVLIYKSLLELLRSKGEVIINDNRQISPLFLERIGIQNQERLSNKTWLGFTYFLLLSAIKNFFTKNQLYFVTGVGEHFINGRKDIIKNHVATLLCFILRSLKVKLVRIGMSVKFGGKQEANSEKALSRFFNYYYVRDSLSLKFCWENGMKKVKLAPDLSWAYKVESNIQQGEKYFIFNFRSFCDSENNQESYVAKLEKAIFHIASFISSNHKEYKIRIVHQVDKDYEFIKSLYQKLRNQKFNVELIDQLITLENANMHYSNSSFVFSNRLHVLLLAYKFDALSIGVTDINKHVKITGIFNDAHLDNLLIDINQSQKEIETQLADIIGHEEDLRRKMKESERVYLNELQQINNTIFI